MTFLETPRLPDEIAYWAQGGPNYKTSIVVVNSGREQRNQTWQYGKGEWNIVEALRLPDGGVSTYNLRVLRDFYRVVKGQTYGFRMKDFTDYLDDGNGILTVTTGNIYQMFKNYTTGSLTDTRLIAKPVAGTIAIYKDAVLLTVTTDYTIDTTTGLVTFTVNPAGHTLAWTGQFDCPVRFGTDIPLYGMGNGGLYSWASIPIIEVRT